MPVDPTTPEPSGQSVPAEAAPPPESAAGGQHPAGHTHCLNCGAKLAGPYCHACGQHDFDVYRSFWHTLKDALEGLINFEGKFLRNLVTLLFQPGRLSVDYNAGKRAVQMPPFRLYLFVSLTFFALTFFDTEPGRDFKIGPQKTKPAEILVDDKPADAGEVLREFGKELADDSKPGRNVDKLRSAAERVADRAQTQKDAEPKSPAPAAEPKSDLARWLEERGARAADPAVQREMAATFLQHLPNLVLFCVPFFALYTRLLWRKSGQVYLQHLVIALHFHTFIFLWVLFRDGWGFLAGLPGLGLPRWVVIACNLWLALYPLVMLRRIFGQGKLLTLLKTLTIALLYTLTLGVGFLIVGFLVVFVL